MKTSIMKPCRVRNVCDTRVGQCVVCIFKNSPRIHVSCPFQRCRVRATQTTVSRLYCQVMFK